MNIPKLIDKFNNTDVKDVTLDFLVDMDNALKFYKWEYITLLQVAQRLYKIYFLNKVAL